MKIEDFFVDLNALQDEVSTKHYQLSNDFWQLFDNSLIQKGLIEADVTIERKAKFFELHVDVDGVVQIPCDRCLDDVDVRVERQDDFIVKLGDEDDYGEDLIIINENDGLLDIATLIYEAAALSIPVVVSHEEGACNQEMIDILKQHEPQSDEKHVDPRWEKLKELKNE